MAAAANSFSSTTAHLARGVKQLGVACVDVVVQVRVVAHAEWLRHQAVDVLALQFPLAVPAASIEYVQYATMMVRLNHPTKRANSA
jgi:hypothetical protein